MIMQCYERQAMYLQLAAEAVIEIPHLQFDRILLDEVLSDFSIQGFNALITLDNKRKRQLIKHIKEISESQGLQEENLDLYRALSDTSESSVRSQFAHGRIANRLAS
jgi:hypothetical protein